MDRAWDEDEQSDWNGKGPVIGTWTTSRRDACVVLNRQSFENAPKMVETPHVWVVVPARGRNVPDAYCHTDTTECFQTSVYRQYY